MRLFQSVFALILTLVVAFAGIVPAAQAASSAAIRAFDDVEGAVKNYVGQNLVRSEFGDAKLNGANFSGADLRGAVFNGASLVNANLSRVDFSDGIAYITNFSGANLNNAIFTSALLLKSVFKNASIAGADFSDASLDRAQVAMLCKIATGTNPVTGMDTKESLGCK
jgi:uncharacterized protein YjbI with pentapeptide repeats